MLNQKPERLTYAQARLVKLIEERKLRRWCLDNGLTHTAIYRIAMGEQPTTYRIIASMCHLIAPIEWLFFTDEKLPFEPELFPKWTCETPPKYVKEHRYDYKTIAQKYELDSMNAYNIFGAYRTNPTPAFIRKLCIDGINPMEFFTDCDSEIKPLRGFIPQRGDIVSVDGKIICVITKKESNEKHKSFSGCQIIAKGADGIMLESTVTKGMIRTDMIQSFPIITSCFRTLIEKLSPDITERVLEEVRKELS